MEVKCRRRRKEKIYFFINVFVNIYRGNEEIGLIGVLILLRFIIFYLFRGKRFCWINIS